MDALNRRRPMVSLTHLKPLDHRASMSLAGIENKAMSALLRSLDEADWHAPTDCERWSVRDIVAHLIGWGEALTSLREGGHQVRAALGRLKEFGNILDAQNQVQVDDRKTLPPAQLIADYERTSARFLRLRGWAAIPGRALPMYVQQIGWHTVGQLADTIFTRDTFMHRIDISRATGKTLELGPAQQILVTDVARDWARRAVVPMFIDLTGAAGVTLSDPSPRVDVEFDAIDFCRFMAGRVPPEEVNVKGPDEDVERCLAVRAPF